MSRPFKRVILRLCESCHAEYPMTRVGQWKERGWVWYRCLGCHAVTHVPVEELQETKEILLSETLSESNGECIPYDPHRVFNLGQRVYHRGWDDEGVVIKKLQTSGGLDKIVVAFKRSGTKGLIEGLKDDTPRSTSSSEGDR